MNRDDFLGRVRRAAQAGRLHRVHTRDVSADVGYVGAGDCPPARLAAEIGGVGGQPWLVADPAAARGRLRDLIEAKRPQTVLCWQHPLLEALGVREAVQAAGAQPLSHEQLASSSPEERRAAVLAADLGIAATDWAVAETGSLAVCAKPGQERIVTLLPPVLISIVDASRIVPDLFDLFARLPAVGAESTPAEMEGGFGEHSPPHQVRVAHAESTPAGMESGFGGHSPPYQVRDGEQAPHLPSSLVLITGPSKTGDIELQLTTGVHGPGEWHVIVIGEAVAVETAEVAPQGPRS